MLVKVVGDAVEDRAVRARAVGVVGRAADCGDELGDLTVPEVVSGGVEPLVGRGHVLAVPGCSGGPELTGGVIEVEDADDVRGGELLLEDAPEAAGAVADPDGLRSGCQTLSERLELEALGQSIDRSQHSDQPSLPQPSDLAARAVGAVFEPGNDADLDLAPDDAARGRSVVGSERDHDPVGADHHQEPLHGGLHRLAAHRRAHRDLRQFCFQSGARLLAGHLDPLPHRAGSDPDGRESRHDVSGGRQRNENGQQRRFALELSAVALVKRQTLRLVQRRPFAPMAPPRTPPHPPPPLHAAHARREFPRCPPLAVQPSTTPRTRRPLRRGHGPIRQLRLQNLHAHRTHQPLHRSDHLVQRHGRIHCRYHFLQFRRLSTYSCQQTRRHVGPLSGSKSPERVSHLRRRVVSMSAQPPPTSGCAQLRVNFHHYIHDRVSGTHALPSLADVIRERAADLNLGASWMPAQAASTPDP